MRFLRIIMMFFMVVATCGGCDSDSTSSGYNEGNNNSNPTNAGGSSASKDKNENTKPVKVQQKITTANYHKYFSIDVKITSITKNSIKYKITVDNISGYSADGVTLSVNVEMKIYYYLNSKSFTTISKTRSDYHTVNMYGTRDYSGTGSVFYSLLSGNILDKVESYCSVTSARGEVTVSTFYQ